MPQKKIEVLIVDDSPVACQLLRYILESDPAIQVVGTCSNGKEALHSIASIKPDVIVMDIQMPVMDGFEATRRIMSTKPIPIVICSAYYSQKDVDTSFKALDAGALAILEKPAGVQSPDFERTVKLFIDTIKNVSEVKLITRKYTTNKPSEPKEQVAAVKDKEIEAVAIGASLGGPQALQTIFAGLHRNFKVPILVAQHIPEEFSQGLATWITETTHHHVVVPEQGDTPKPGIVYIVPGRSYMEIAKDGTFVISKSSDALETGPTISTLFDSVAKHYGDKAVGVILTGMGRDGTDGLLTLKKTGAITVAQSSEDCIMFGMPKEAINIGAVTHIVNLKEISAFLNQLI